MKESPTKHIPPAPQKKCQGKKEKRKEEETQGVAEFAGFLGLQSLAVTGPGTTRPRGKLHSSGGRIQTPKDSGTFHVSFLEHCGRASSKLCRAYIIKHPHVRPQIPTSDVTQTGFFPLSFTQSSTFGAKPFSHEGLRNSAHFVLKVHKNARKDISLCLNTKGKPKKKKNQNV